MAAIFSSGLVLPSCRLRQLATLFSVMTPENPFVFGEIIDDARFVDRTDELDQLVRDLLSIE